PAPMPFLVLLDEAMRRLRTHLRAIFPAVALPIALLTTLLQVVQILSLRGVLNAERAPGAMPLFWTPWVLLGALILGVVSAVAYTAGQVAALDALSGRPIDMGRAWRFAAQPAVWGPCSSRRCSSSSPSSSAWCPCSTWLRCSPSPCRRWSRRGSSAWRRSPAAP